MSHLRIAQGSISHHGNNLRVPDQPNGAKRKSLGRATIGISAPFTLAERIVERFAELRATGDSTISSG
jgi:hypothetical protein